MFKTWFLKDDVHTAIGPYEFRFRCDFAVDSAVSNIVTVNDIRKGFQLYELRCRNSSLLHPQIV